MAIESAELTEQPGKVRLTPMSEADYQQFLAAEIEDYAKDQVEAGTWRPENARELSQQEFASLLPEGLATPEQYLYMIVRAADAQKVGCLWYGVRESEGNRYSVLYDFLIYEAYRRKGYGSAALSELERHVRQHGIGRIALNVFGHNHPARALYRKLGYVERNITMVKEI